MIKGRRQLGLALVGLAASLLVLGQSASRNARVGIIFWSLPASRLSEGWRWSSFSASLAALGWIEGRNLELILRTAELDKDAVAGIVDELIRLEVDVIVATHNPVALEAKRRTRTVPIVVRNAGMPVKAGLVDSVTHPGGNVTGGIVGAADDGKRLALLKEAAPFILRVAWLSDDSQLATDRLDPAGLSQDLIPKTLNRAAHKLGITLVRWEVNTPSQVEHTFAMLKQQKIDGLFVDTPKNRERIVELARLHRLPAIYSWWETVRAGGLMSYAASGDAASTAAFVDKILRGAKPGDLPMELPKTYELWLNLTAAKAIGLTIPPSLRAQATQTIE